MMVYVNRIINELPLSDELMSLNIQNLNNLSVYLSLNHQPTLAKKLLKFMMKHLLDSDMKMMVDYIHFY
jgi:hypothetical protein